MKSFIGAVLFICVAFSANAQLLWKVSGNGLNQPSYIIGTHHLAPFSIMDSIAGLQKAMKETQQVYGELKMSEMQSPVTMQKMQQAMMIANDSTLSTLLSPEDFATANKFCKENLMLDLSAAPTGFRIIVRPGTRFPTLFPKMPRAELAAIHAPDTEPGRWSLCWDHTSQSWEIDRKSVV